MSERLTNMKSIEQSVEKLGRGIAQRAVLLSNGATFATLPEIARPPEDIDLSVDPDLFHYLRQQEGWKNIRHDQGHPELISNGEFDIASGWGMRENQDHESLRERSWSLPSGLRVAGLADVVAWKETRHHTKDQQDIERIRRRFHDPERPPLSAQYIPYEVSLVRSCLPKYLQDDPCAQPAIELAANGVMMVFAEYGHPEIQRSNQIMGTLELPEYHVPALYHNGFGLIDDMRTLQYHFDRVGASDDVRLLGIVAQAYSDCVYGNGRESDHPDGKEYDEWLSANLLRAHALAAGFDETVAERLWRTVIGTSFDEQTRQQKGVSDPDPLVRGVMGVDAGLAKPGSIRSSIEVAVEDIMSARYSRNRILGRIALKNGIRIASIEEALLCVDEFADVAPDGFAPDQTPRRALAQRLTQGADFHDPLTEIYVPPHDWSLDNPAMRSLHADELRMMSSQILEGEINASDLLAIAEEYEQSKVVQDLAVSA